jgi:hypothetical protein
MTRLIFIVVVLIVSCRGINKPSDKGNPGQTKVVVKWDTLNYILRSCSATVENKSLKLYIERHPDSVSDYAIEISQTNKRFTINVSRPWVGMDCLYIAPRFKILNQDIRLDKANYKKNDNIEGELNLLMLGHKAYYREPGEMKLRENWDTVRCYGVFSSIIK